MKTAVLDEYLIGPRAGNDNARQINSRHVAFKRLEVVLRLHVNATAANSQHAEEIVIRVIAGHSEYEIVGDLALTLRGVEEHAVGGNLFYRGIKICCDLA